MKLLKNILFTLLMSLALTAFATDQGLKVDLLMAKITASLKADKAVDALPYFDELEGMESTLTKPLPESFHFYYIEALIKSGNNEKALSRADIYLSKFGKKGKYYDKVIEIISPIQIQKDKEAKVRADEANRVAQEEEHKQQKYKKEKESYQGKIQACENHEYNDRIDSVNKDFFIARDKCTKAFFDDASVSGEMTDSWERYHCSAKISAVNRRNAMYEISKFEWCKSQYQEPRKPE